MAKTHTNPFRWILWIWLAYACFFLFAATYVGSDKYAISNGVLDSSYAVLAFLSLLLFRREMDSGNKAVFFNLLLFFGLNAAIYPTQLLLLDILLPIDKYFDVYFYQYDMARFFLLLPLSLVFILTHSMFPIWSTTKKYLGSVAVVGSIWLYLFYPYFVNPRYLYSTIDVAHFRQIDSAIQTLSQSGQNIPTNREISSNVRLFENRGVGDMRELLGDEKELRIAELLPYVIGSNYIALVFKPLNLVRSYFGAFCILTIVVYLAYHYLVDPPKAAYLEKLMLAFLPYCSFEALHHYIFSTIQSSDRFFNDFVIGQYFSFITLLLVGAVLGLRLKFILSVEGRFYERHLISDASRVTRWRDAFDTWVLRQFMDAGDIERRFAINPRTDDKSGPENQPPR